MEMNSLRQQAERYRSLLELQKFELSQGQRALIDHATLDADFADLLSRESIDLVASACERAARDQDAEQLRRLEMLGAWIVLSFTEREVRAIDLEIEKKARGSRVTDSAGLEYPLRDARLLLAGTERSDERARLDNARVEAARALAPMLAERMSICHGIARSFDKSNLLELWSTPLHVDIERLRVLANEVLESTDDMYREVLGWTVRKRLGVPMDDAHRRDMPYVFAARYTDYDEAFTVKGLVAKARDVLSRMGIDLACEGRLSVIVDPPNRGSAQRAFVCAPAIPGDVRLVLQLADGQRDLLQFLAALGRGLFLGSIDAATPFEDRVLGDGALDLTYSRIFQDLLLDRSWLKRSFGFQRPKDYLVMATLERLFDLRLVCARVLYELDLYQQATIEHMPEHFVEIFRRALVVQTPPEFYLHEVRRPFLSAFQLRARVFEALYTQHLTHYFNQDWWQNPQTGSFLKKEWSHGRRLDVEARAREMGYDGLLVAPLVKQFVKTL